VHLAGVQGAESPLRVWWRLCLRLFSSPFAIAPIVPPHGSATELNRESPSVVACGGLVQGPDVVETSYELIYS